jgi:hypothetical protein
MMMLIFLRREPSLLCSLSSWRMEAAHARLYGDDLSCIFKLCVRKLGMTICSGGVIPVSSICVVHRC